MNMPVLFEDLGTRLIGSHGHKTRYGLYICPCCDEVFESISGHIKSSHTKRCKDCSKAFRSDRMKNMPRFVKHGMTGTRMHFIWVNMKFRCYNPSADRYIDYGGRGIRVCDEWEEFIKFMEWSNVNGYSEDLTIDRIDNDGNYEPSNCRWATRSQQQLNKRPPEQIARDRASSLLRATGWEE